MSELQIYYDLWSFAHLQLSFCSLFIVADSMWSCVVLNHLTLHEKSWSWQKNLKFCLHHQCTRTVNKSHGKDSLRIRLEHCITIQCYYMTTDWWMTAKVLQDSAVLLHCGMQLFSILAVQFWSRPDYAHSVSVLLSCAHQQFHCRWLSRALSRSRCMLHGAVAECCQGQAPLRQLVVPT